MTFMLMGQWLKNKSPEGSVASVFIFWSRRMNKPLVLIAAFISVFWL